MDELASQEQTGVTGEGVVVVPDLDQGATAATWSRMAAHSKVPPARAVVQHFPIRAGTFVAYGLLSARRARAPGTATESSASFT